LNEEGEVYIRGKMGKKRKVAAREELPRGRELVSNPLTLEEEFAAKKLEWLVGGKRVRRT
jgi:hypothetical protein